MADILLACSGQIGASALQGQLITTSRARKTYGSMGPISYAIARVDNLHMWSPAISEEQGRIVLISGRIALTASEWDVAERLADTGGLAARHLLSEWSTSSTKEVPCFNGAGIAVFIDLFAGIGLLRTDRIGCAPIFASKGDSPLIIGSHPDSIAATLAELGHPSPLDELTMAEFVRTGTSVHPHTYYRNIEQLDAGSLYRFDLAGSAEKLRHLETYWSPATVNGDKPASRSEFVEALAGGLRKAGQLRSSVRMGRPVVLLSAGADSRGVLSALSSPAEAQTYTYYDEPNPELQRAQEIARIVGAPHRPLKRDQNFYIANAMETTRLSGGMWSMESGHHTGFVDEIWATPNFGTLLTGCYADYLLKGIALSVTTRNVFGKPLPLHRLSSIHHCFHHPFTPVHHEFEKRSEERYATRFADAIAQNNRYALEYLRIAPLSREADASGRLALWRQFPIDPIFADTHVLDAFSVQSIQDKLSGIAFGMGIASVAGPEVSRVPNNNYSAPVGTGEFGRAAAFLGASVRRKIERRLKPKTAFHPKGVETYGSWPNFRIVFSRSDVARQWFDGLAGRGYYGFVGADRLEWSFENFVDRDIIQLMRLLTVYLWRENFAVDPRRLNTSE
jgi:asparagine synthase (glutamine-hydrolysing)